MAGALGAGASCRECRQRARHTVDSLRQSRQLTGGTMHLEMNFENYCTMLFVTLLRRITGFCRHGFVCHSVQSDL